MDTIGRKKVRDKIMKTTGIAFLPDELITIILNKLPAKSVMRCRLVCKTWKDFTLAHDFVELNLTGTIPSIFVAARSISHSKLLDLFALDKWWESTETSLIIDRFPFHSEKFDKAHRAELSHAGLVVLHSDSQFTILNPARPSHERVTIILTQKLYKSNIYGVYFHPLLKEYCVLLEIKQKEDDTMSIGKYKMLNLGSNPSSKTISNPCSSQHKLGYARPLLINNYLYWMLERELGCRYAGCNDIMEFGIISEQFRVIPCPIPLNTKCMHQHTRLLNIDGVLNFVMLLSRKLTILKLEDRAERLWTTTEYNLSRESSIWWEAVGVIAIVNGKLAIVSQRILYVYNLMDGTVKQKSKYGIDSVFLSHQMSLASLKNCKSTIFIDKDGEVDRQEPDLW